MNTKLNAKFVSALTLALATLAAGNAQTVDPAAPKTRAQVKAELLEAQRTGDIIMGGEQGWKLNELFPGRYPRREKAE